VPPAQATNPHDNTKSTNFTATFHSPFGGGVFQGESEIDRFGLDVGVGGGRLLHPGTDRELFGAGAGRELRAEEAGRNLCAGGFGERLKFIAKQPTYCATYCTPQGSKGSGGPRATEPSVSRQRQRSGPEGRSDYSALVAGTGVPRPYNWANWARRRRAVGGPLESVRGGCERLFCAGRIRGGCDRRVVACRTAVVGGALERVHEAQERRDYCEVHQSREALLMQWVSG